MKTLIKNLLRCALLNALPIPIVTMTLVATVIATVIAPWTRTNFQSPRPFKVTPAGDHGSILLCLWMTIRGHHYWTPAHQSALEGTCHQCLAASRCRCHCCTVTTYRSISLPCFSLFRSVTAAAGTGAAALSAAMKCIHELLH